MRRPCPRRRTRRRRRTCGSSPATEFVAAAEAAARGGARRLRRDVRAAVTRRPRRARAGCRAGRSSTGRRGPSGRVGPSRPCASWPRTSASTSRRHGDRTGRHRHPRRRPRAAGRPRAGARRRATPVRASCSARAGPPYVDGERREPVRGVRKHMAEAMVRTAFTIPHVTEWTEVDVTRSVKLMRRLRETPGFHDARVSPLLLVARAVLLMREASSGPQRGLRRGDRRGRLQATTSTSASPPATPRGLVVPNIKAADRLSLPELAAALEQLGRTARDGRTTPADMSGGTFTITNVGVFGIDGGTPIINPGEAAILAVGAFRERPWVHKGKVQAALGRAARAVVRPPAHRRRDGLTVPRRRRVGAVRPGHAAGQPLTRAGARGGD